MRGYLKSLLVFGMLCNITTAWAVGKGVSCRTDQCDAGLYCDATTYTCASCAESTGSKYPNSDGNATLKEHCYKSCGPDQTVNLGKITPIKRKIYYPSTEECKYKLTCTDRNTSEPNADNTACQCKSTYQQSPTNTCIGKCYTITLDNNLESAHQTQFLSVKYDDGFYIGSSCGGTKLDKNTTAEPNTTGGWIIPTNIKWWQKFNGYSTEETGGTTRFGSDGKPTNGTNNKTFTDNTTLYGQWNKNNYTIKYYDGETLLTSLNQSCQVANYDASTPEPASENSCPAKSSNEAKEGKTITGWSLTKGGTTKNYVLGANIPPSSTSAEIKLYAVWESCPAGYYCNASGKNPCPAGATSESGSTKIENCYISSATQFIDKYETKFTLPLPINYKINYAP